MTQLHTLKRTETRAKTRVGRGGKRGKTAGRGTKGQSARAGNKKRPEWRDTIKKLPKLRGHGKNRARTVYADRPRPIAVSLDRITSAFVDNDVVSPLTLVEKKVIVSRGNGMPRVKLVGKDITVRIIVEQCAVTAGARASIEKAGGTIK